MDDRASAVWDYTGKALIYYLVLAHGRFISDKRSLSPKNKYFYCSIMPGVMWACTIASTCWLVSSRGVQKLRRCDYSPQITFKLPLVLNQAIMKTFTDRIMAVPPCSTADWDVTSQSWEVVCVPEISDQHTEHALWAQNIQNVGKKLDP